MLYEKEIENILIGSPLNMSLEATAFSIIFPQQFCHARLHLLNYFLFILFIVVTGRN